MLSSLGQGCCTSYSAQHSPAISVAPVLKNTVPAVCISPHPSGHQVHSTLPYKHLESSSSSHSQSQNSLKASPTPRPLQKKPKNKNPSRSGSKLIFPPLYISSSPATDLHIPQINLPFFF